MKFSVLLAVSAVSIGVLPTGCGGTGSDCDVRSDACGESPSMSGGDAGLDLEEYYEDRYGPAEVPVDPSDYDTGWDPEGYDEVDQSYSYEDNRPYPVDTDYSPGIKRQEASVCG